MTKKRKLRTIQSQQPKPPQAVSSKGKVVINNINNGQEQTNNNIQITKRRKLRPSLDRMKKTEQEEDNAIESEEQGGFADSESKEEGLANLDTSFDSVDNHPNATHYYDYFKGNGQKEWRAGQSDPPNRRRRHQYLKHNSRL